MAWASACGQTWSALLHTTKQRPDFTSSSRMLCFACRILFGDSVSLLLFIAPVCKKYGSTRSESWTDTLVVERLAVQHQASYMCPVGKQKLCTAFRAEELRQIRILQRSSLNCLISKKQSFLWNMYSVHYQLEEMRISQTRCGLFWPSFPPRVLWLRGIYLLMLVWGTEPLKQSNRLSVSEWTGCIYTEKRVGKKYLYMLYWIIGRSVTQRADDVSHLIASDLKVISLMLSKFLIVPKCLFPAFLCLQWYCMAVSHIACSFSVI